MDYVLSGDDAPAQHEAEAIVDQLGIDLTCEAATASGGIARALAMDPDSTSMRSNGAGGVADALLRRIRGDQP